MPRSVTSTAWRKASTSNSPSTGWRNFIRFSDARLQAVSSRNMYSLHGFDALMRAVLEHVCQALTVLSNCSPGSPHCQAASEMSRNSWRAGIVSITWPSRTAWVDHALSSTTAFMNSSVTRTELLEFWKKMELYASPVKLES